MRKMSCCFKNASDSELLQLCRAISCLVPSFVSCCIQNVATPQLFATNSWDRNGPLYLGQATPSWLLPASATGSGPAAEGVAALGAVDSARRGRTRASVAVAVTPWEPATASAPTATANSGTPFVKKKRQNHIHWTSLTMKKTEKMKSTG